MKLIELNVGCYADEAESIEYWFEQKGITLYRTPILTERYGTAFRVLSVSAGDYVRFSRAFEDWGCGSSWSTWIHQPTLALMLEDGLGVHVSEYSDAYAGPIPIAKRDVRIWIMEKRGLLDMDGSPL